MSQTPPGDPFIPPPPPSTVIGNPMYPPNVLESKAAEVRDDSRNALILGIIGLICFGFILGYLAIRKANAALETIAIYEVAQERRAVAITAKVLGFVDIIGWVVVLILRIVTS